MCCVGYLEKMIVVRKDGPVKGKVVLASGTPSVAEAGYNSTVDMVARAGRVATVGRGAEGGQIRARLSSLSLRSVSQPEWSAIVDHRYRRSRNYA
jgi:hypothetical protein